MRDYAVDIWRCRYFWMSLVKMDLRVRYRRSVLGLGWSLLNPIAMTAVLCTVFHNLFDVDIPEYAPFLFSGLTFWGFLSSAVIQGCDCFYAGETYIRQHPAPLAIYPLRTVLGAAFHFSVALVVVLGLTWCCKGADNLATLPALLPSLPLLLVLGWSLAVLAGFANVFFPDMKHLLEIALQMAYYATPVIYPPKILKEKGLAWLVDYNPVAELMALIRQPIVYAEVPSAYTYTIVTLTTLAAAAGATWVLVKWQRRLIFYL